MTLKALYFSGEIKLLQYQSILKAYAEMTIATTIIPRTTAILQSNDEDPCEFGSTDDERVLNAPSKGSIFSA
ncbi:MAG: hypothetical protein E3J86_05010 [Candidatus Thorarchaeota archaeon]|nr:MAG: hypothetical protein E3J86_05010 [Candidatus Thorarchaeota archaeon]